MIDQQIIKYLNSKNVSTNPNETKERLEIIWKDMTKMKKDEAVRIGGFSNTRSFNKTRGSGLISVRMVIAISIAMQVNPFYITAEEDDINCYSEEKIIDFIRKNNLESYLEERVDGVDKVALTQYMSSLISNLSNSKVEEINQLSNNDLGTLLSAVLIRDRIDDKEENRIFLLKLLLTS